MKIILLILGFVAVATATSIVVREQDPESIYKELLAELMKEHDTKKPISANINEFLDTTLQLVQEWIRSHELDPAPVEDLEKGFSLWIAFIKWHGEFAIYNGLMHGISTVQREGNATMTYDSNLLQVYLPLRFDTILVDYDYKIKFMNLGPSGGVEGKIKNLEIIVDIAINTTTLEITLQGFRISDSGRITVRFTGNPLVDILTNIITSLATTMLHGVALGVIQNQVRDALETVIENINNSINSINPSILSY